jgi:DNA-binding PadR family transcriptional regulator
VGQTETDQGAFPIFGGLMKDPNNGPAWSNVPALLVSDPNLKSTAKLTALALGCHTRPTFDATVSRSILAATVSVSLATIRRGLQDLERHGWITVTREKLSSHDNAVNTYRWNFAQARLAAARMRKGRAVRPITAPPGVTGEPTPGVKKTPLPRVTSEPHTSSSIRKEPKGPRPASQRMERAGRSGPTHIGVVLKSDAELDDLFGSAGVTGA